MIFSKAINGYWFVLLLPLFFISHGAAQYCLFVPASIIFFLLFKYILIALFITGIYFFLFRNIYRSCWAAFITLLIYLFFGNFHDLIKSIAGKSFFTSYTLWLPLIISILGFSLMRLRRRMPGSIIRRYFNILFSFLILIDIITIIYKSVSSINSKEYSVNSGSPKPDIFFIIIDGYAGADQLKAEFNFDNKPFLDSLTSLGFNVIPRSRSNYVRTEFSMSSMMNMEYHHLNNYEVTPSSLEYCFTKIARNKVVAYLEKTGYEFVNCSIFDIAGKPSHASSLFLVSGADLVENQTLWNRVRRDIFVGIVMKYLKNSFLYRDLLFNYYRNDEKLLADVTSELKKEHEKPQFVYAHFELTHAPYYFDSSGKLNKPEDMDIRNYARKDLYLDNLKANNIKILGIINSIRKYETKPSVILLASDHGFRYGTKPALALSNLAAVNFPSHDYRLYYDSVSNVNQFPILFNTLFNAGFKLLPDTSGQPVFIQREE
jgi:hypothetical protein